MDLVTKSLPEKHAHVCVVAPPPLHRLSWLHKWILSAVHGVLPDCGKCVLQFLEILYSVLACLVEFKVFNSSLLGKRTKTNNAQCKETHSEQHITIWVFFCYSISCLTFSGYFGLEVSIETELHLNSGAPLTQFCSSCR